MALGMIGTLTKYGYAPVKISDKNGGEYACPCPWCGGNDRLRIFPNSIFGGNFFCRNCNIGGGIAFFSMIIVLHGIPKNTAQTAPIKEDTHKEISGLCYCENEQCGKMWPVSCGVDGPQDADGHTILPCGHRLERLVASAECFRSDNRDAEDYRWLRGCRHISDDAMDELDEHKTEQGR